MGASLIWVH